MKSALLAASLIGMSFTLFSARSLAETSYTSDDGEEYVGWCNGSGVILRAQNSGALLSLGRSCDASLSAQGRGWWCRDERGVAAHFRRMKFNVFFSNQGIYCQNPNLTPGCHC